MEVPTKELKFIHITKTAGSSIETVGLEMNKRWGIHHKEYGFWHSLFPSKPESLKKRYDWFMVVRNPYTRVLSEYHFIAKALGHADHNKTQFNSFIKKWITNSSNDKENHPVYGRIGGDHFTEQYRYLDPNINIHILKFENIEDDFNDLMKRYNYKIVLNKKVQVSKQIFTLHDISNDNVDLIKTIYKTDFELFDYDIDINKYLDKLPPRIINRRELKFIHITKNAGSSIEQVGFENKKMWGKHHKEYGYHHSLFTKKAKSFKEKYDWFTVVRNPYTRVLSEFHYLCDVIPTIKSFNKDEFNTFICKWIKGASKGEKENVSVGRDHFTEQYKYIDPKVKIHILKFENLEDEFNDLMKTYNYNIVLNKKVMVSKKIFTQDDLSNKTLSLINSVYKKDFELFGYDIQHVDINQSTQIEEIIYDKSKLKYIPISRIGNTYINEVAKQLNVAWGEKHKEYGWRFEKFINKSAELRSKYEWFMVVRNPYTRILSEYMFLKDALFLNVNHNVSDFNRIIEKWITNIENNKQNHIQFGRQIGDHFTEQYNYYDKGAKIYIIKYENLQEELNILLDQYDYNMIIPSFQVETNFPYSLDDISYSNIKLINRVYEKDFKLFGYKMKDVDNTETETIEAEPIETEPIETEPIATENICIGNNIQKQLKFIHITRTAGTSIEQVGLDQNKLWGRYDRAYGTFDEPFILKSDAIKNNYEWFTVVRNPYTRVISEYNYLKIVLRLRNCDNLKVFNNYIENWLTNIKNNSKYQIHGYHLMPQYKYIDNKHIINILKYENLPEEFNELMNKYNYSVKLNRIVCSSNTKFTVSDLSEKNINLINEVYKKDFEQFGYPIS